MFDRPTTPAAPRPASLHDIRTMPGPWREVRERFLQVLEEAQRHRGEMPELVQFAGERAPAWHIFELKKMLEAVNKERQKLNLPEVTMDAVVKVNQYATGHSDYTRKFALYCAELGVGQDSVCP
jgi:uncharacterized protein YkwD